MFTSQARQTLSKTNSTDWWAPEEPLVAYENRCLKIVTSGRSPNEWYTQQWSSAHFCMELKHNSIPMACKMLREILPTLSENNLRDKAWRMRIKISFLGQTHATSIEAMIIKQQLRLNWQVVKMPLLRLPKQVRRVNNLPQVKGTASRMCWYSTSHRKTSITI